MTQFIEIIKNYFAKLVSSWSFLFWNILFTISLLASVLLITSDMTQYKYNGNPLTRKVWQEHIYLWFKFTLISNVLSMIISFLVVINIINYKNRHLQRLKIMINVNLTITMLVFWTLIFPKRGISYYNSYTFIATILAHLIVPILAMVTFIIDIKFMNIKKDKNIHLLKTSLINISFLILWSIVAIIIYYSFGAEKKDAIYTFIALQQNSWYISTIIILLITLLYFALTYFYGWLYKR